MHLMVAMGEVQARHIHACVDKLDELLDIPASRSDGAHNLQEEEILGLDTSINLCIDCAFTI